MEPIISVDAARRATERLAPDQLTDLLERAAPPDVGVEAAHEFVAHGEEIPEPLLAELTEYRQITRSFARVSSSESQTMPRSSHCWKIRRCLASTFNPVVAQTTKQGERVA